MRVCGVEMHVVSVRDVGRCGEGVWCEGVCLE